MGRKVRSAIVGGLLVMSFAATVPDISTASPGGLDGRGGHHCWTKCKRYGMYTGQYHCHQSPCGRKDIRRHRAHGH